MITQLLNYKDNVCRRMEVMAADKLVSDPAENRSQEVHRRSRKKSLLSAVMTFAP